MYGFYSKNDPTQEIIFKTDGKSKVVATKYFSFLKQMEEDEFEKLYQVIKLK